MTPSYFTLTLDTRPPGNPSLLINGGVAVTGDVDVVLDIATSDYQGGSADVTLMKIWGDVDPTVDPLVQSTEAASAFQTFQEQYTIRLSAGDARKTIFARLQDDVCNVTIPFSDFIDLNTMTPVVQIITAVDGSRLSKQSGGCGEVAFQWQSSRAFEHYEVRAVPTISSPHEGGTLIGTTFGSINTSADGTFVASTPITTTIRGADLEAASPGDGDKVVKVFVRQSDGTWSP